MDLEALTRSRSELVGDYFFKQRLALVFIFGFVFAVFVSSFIFVSPIVSVWLALLAFAVLAGEKIWHKKVNKETIVFSVILISLSLGSLRYAIKDFHIPEPSLESAVGNVIEITGIVVDEPEPRESSTRLLIKTPSEKILVSTSLYSHAEYGDEVRASGKLSKPGTIESDDGGRPFDYGKYLSKDDIYFIMNFAKIETLSSGHGSPVKRILFKIKRSFVEQTKEILSEPHSSLLAGLVVSGREAMPKGILEEFRRAGVVHIVVLSGYNITIIADFIRRLFENLLIRTGSARRFALAGPRLAAGASIASILLFVLMTGAQATVVRAAIMVLAVLAAKLFGRSYSAPRALLGAAFLMVVQNPKILAFDPSFQLSFLATFALIYVVPILDRFMRKLPQIWGLKSVAVTTIGTQIVILPLLVYSVGDFSLVSLPANMLILLIIPVTMLVGFLAVLISQASLFLALPLSYAAYILLSWILGISSFFGNLPFASVDAKRFPLWIAVGMYVLLFSWVVRDRLRLKRGQVFAREATLP